MYPWKLSESRNSISILEVDQPDKLITLIENKNIHDKSGNMLEIR